MSGELTLVDFLRARLDDAVRSIAHWDSDGRCQVATMWTGGEPGYTTVASAHPGSPWVADGREVANPRHVRVLYDPARVLADVEAKRRLLAEYEEDSQYLARQGLGADMRDIGRLEGLETALRHLAAPYAQHPDYRAEWAAVDLADDDDQP